MREIVDRESTIVASHVDAETNVAVDHLQRIIARSDCNFDVVDYYRVANARGLKNIYTCNVEAREGFERAVRLERYF